MCRWILWRPLLGLKMTDVICPFPTSCSRWLIIFTLSGNFAEKNSVKMQLNMNIFSIYISFFWKEMVSNKESNHSSFFLSIFSFFPVWRCGLFCYCYVGGGFLCVVVWEQLRMCAAQGFYVFHVSLKHCNSWTTRHATIYVLQEALSQAPSFNSGPLFSVI